MYDDFSYITDEQFLENYWNTEKMLCSYYPDLRKRVVSSKLKFSQENVSKINPKESHQDIEASDRGSCVNIIPV